MFMEREKSKSSEKLGRGTHRRLGIAEHKGGRAEQAKSSTRHIFAPNLARKAVPEGREVQESAKAGVNEKAEDGLVQSSCD